MTLVAIKTLVATVVLSAESPESVLESTGKIQPKCTTSAVADGRYLILDIVIFIIDINKGFKTKSEGGGGVEMAVIGGEGRSSKCKWFVLGLARYSVDTRDVNYDWPKAYH